MDSRTFVLRRLHSLAGIIPVGVFLLSIYTLIRMR